MSRKQAYFLGVASALLISSAFLGGCRRSVPPPPPPPPAGAPASSGLVAPRTSAHGRISESGALPTGG